MARNIPKPTKFLSDLRQQFFSKKFENFLFDNVISHVKTSPYNPTSNGISERINSAIAYILGMNKGSSLKKAVKKVEIHLNFTHHTILNASPMELINGYSVFDILNRDISSKFNELKKQEKIKKRQGNKK
ncbi:Gag-Pro-Pol polyprotein [Dictyocoela muelleri]|nr:Gag-Pro-Pol polyprotein [Dictyocoela muelleri]